MTEATKPSGSFVLWENTLCNPLSDPRSMAHSAWHDGYASAKAERKPLTKEQIMSIDVLRYHFALNGGAGPISKKGKEIIDAIERAHGIGEQHE